MKIVVIGGTGLIGAQVVRILNEQGHEGVAASPSRGVNAVTGEGLDDALIGAEVVVDVSNPPSFDDQVSMEFFETSGRNLKAAEVKAGIQHHVALSVVGTERLQEMGYFRAKLAQEKWVESAGIPYTIVRATQFFEFVGGIASAGKDDQTVRLPPVLMQPIASEEVAETVAKFALHKPMNGIVEVAGPERIRMDELVRRFLVAQGNLIEVIADPQARYFSSSVNDQSLIPDADPLSGRMTFEEWLSRSVPSVATF